MSHRKPNLLAWPVAAVVLGLAAIAPELRAVETRGRIAVASEHPLASQAALAQLRAGGNAVDAAVTAALVAGVANPTSSGIGGGGFVLHWSSAHKRATVIDFRETAPAAIDVAAFERRPFAHAERGKSVGVPGEIAGLFELHRRFGKRTWLEVVGPAVDVAQQGFAVAPHLERALRSQSDALRRDAKIAQLFYPAQSNPAGPRLTNPGLAHVLSFLSVLGPRAVYDGPVAADLVATTLQAYGALSYNDLRGYRPLDREPLHLRWEGYDVYTMPPPSAGGLMLIEALSMFSKAELSSWGIDSGAYIHHLAESMRGSLADRMRYLGDPAFEAVNPAKLLAPGRLAKRRATLAPFKSRTLPQFVAQEHGTHHLVTADAWGDVVALTTTVNNPFGAKLMTRSGILLNDELDDFSKQADAAMLGLAVSPNRPRPGARPVSSMTPTLVIKDGKPVLALGGSGGMRIATNVSQALLARLVFGLSPQQVVTRPRFFVPPGGPTLMMDAASQGPLLVDLRARGEVIEPLGPDFSAVQMVAVEQGRWLPAADPRKSGLALAE